MKVWGYEDGLSLGFKNSMLKDKKGFLWVTSPLGINKFDGGKFQVYYPENNDPAKPNSAYSFSVIEDSLHNLWIGTNKGLVYYNTESENFGNIYPKITSNASITTMIPFGASREEIFCIESATYITAYDIKTQARRQIAEISGNLTLKNNLTMQSSVYDPLGQTIWVMKGDQSQNDEGLLAIDSRSGKIRYFNWPCHQKKINHSHMTRGMCLDIQRRMLWINSADGLLTFNLLNERIDLAPGSKGIAGKNDYYNAIGIGVDKWKNIWVATNSDGMQVYKPEAAQFEPLFTDPGKQRRSGQYNMTIYFDKDNMVWLGYAEKKGLFQLIKQQSAVGILPGNNMDSGQVYNLCEGKQGAIIVSNTDGIRIVKPGQFTAASFSHSSGFHSAPKDILLNSNLRSGHSWILQSWNRKPSIVQLHLKGNKRIEFPRDKSFQVESSIIPVLTTPLEEGCIIMADYLGIYHLMPDVPEARKIINIPYHVTNLELCDNRYIFIRLHFTARNLCYKYDGNRWDLFTNPIDSINWSSIKYDKRSGGFWVGELHQLSQYDKDFRLLNKYKSKDGVDLNDILDIQTDNEGNIWFFTNKGQIFRLQPGSGTIIQLSDKDGYTGNIFNWLTPSMVDSTGNLYIAGEKGITIVDTKKIRNFPPANIYIRNFLVNQQPYPVRFDGGDITPVKLTYQQTNLSFEVGILDFYNQEHSRIQYRMEGVNDNWQTTMPGQPIHYIKLPPGKYTFTVQASSSGNNFNGIQKTFSIEIKPAIWQTISFWVLVLLVIAMTWYFLSKNRTIKEFKRKMEISKKERMLVEMKQRTNELEQQALALEMQILRTQMNPHFIFNSLNSVNRFILQNNKANASSYLTKFSKLIRMILQHSQEQQISLENELGALHLYLELESIRFENRFEYKITVQPSLDITAVQVPPLIMQPYIENAIWHGLMHKETKGQLDLEITTEGKCLFICITDDGVGREKAIALENQSTSKYKSFGMKITQERILAMGKDNNDASVNIYDLTNPDGTAAGTEVTIKIPLVYD